MASKVCAAGARKHFVWRWLLIVFVIVFFPLHLGRHLLFPCPAALLLAGASTSYCSHGVGWHCTRGHEKPKTASQLLPVSPQPQGHQPPTKSLVLFLVLCCLKPAVLCLRELIIPIVFPLTTETETPPISTGIRSVYTLNNPTVIC